MTHRQLYNRGWRLNLTNHDDLGGDRDGRCWAAEFINIKHDDSFSFQIDISTSRQYDGLRWCRTKATEGAWETLDKKLSEAI